MISKRVTNKVPSSLKMVPEVLEPFEVPNGIQNKVK
jgi:hypothetical protein